MGEQHGASAPDPASARDPDPGPAPDDVGGDDACWLDRVCPQCGAFRDPPPPAPCPRCGMADGEIVASG